MPNPTFNAVIGATDQSRSAFASVVANLRRVLLGAEQTKASLVKLEHHNMGGVLGAMSAFKGHLSEAREHAGGLAEHMAHWFPALAGLGAAGSVGGLFELIEHVASARVELDRTAEKLNVSTEALQQFNYTAKMTGMPVEQMQTAMMRLNRAMGDAAMGKNKNAAAVLARIGVSVKDIQSGAVKAPEVMEKLAQSFSHTENGAIKTSVAMMLLGRGGAQMIPLLDKGSEAWRQLNAEFAQFGLLMSPEQREGLHDYHQGMVRLETAVGGFTDLLAAELAPILTPIVNDMAKWIAANRDWIATGITGEVKDFTTYLQSVDWAGHGQELKDIAVQANAIADAFGGWKRVIEGIIAIKLTVWAAGVVSSLLPVLRVLAMIPGSGVTAAAVTGIAIAAGLEKAGLAEGPTSSRGGGPAAGVPAPPPGVRPGYLSPEAESRMTPGWRPPGQSSADLARLAAQGLIAPPAPLIDQQQRATVTPIVVPPPPPVASELRFRTGPGTGPEAPSIAPSPEAGGPLAWLLHSLLGGPAKEPGKVEVQVNIAGAPPGTTATTTSSGPVEAGQVNVGTNNPLNAH